MIVRDRPRSWQMMLAYRGSVIPHIIRKLLAIILISVAVVWFEYRYPGTIDALPLTPFTLMGLTLSIFLSFRNNACYDRWWEARKQWGALILEMRSFAREVQCAFPREDQAALRRQLLHTAIGFAHTLCARLRKQDERAAAPAWLKNPDATLPPARKNVSDAMVEHIGRTLAEQYRKHEISDILFQTIEQRLLAFSGIQAACERIRNTPVPFAYTLLLHRTAYLFCILLPFGLAGTMGWGTPLIAAAVAYTFFGLDALGDELEEPFGLCENDLPLSAMVRVIEIDLKESLGEETPEPLVPKHFVLQ